MGRPKLWTEPCPVEDCGRPPSTLGMCAKHYVRWMNHGDPTVVKQGKAERVDVLTRVMRRVDTTGPVPTNRPELGPCWIFSGCLNRTGYGQVTLSFTEGRALVHRVVYERLVGPIPAGLVIDHLCRTPACCNPKHLEPVTQAENTRRGEFANALRRKYAAMTECGNGHARDAKNLVVYRNGKRGCRPCKTEWSRRARERARAVSA